MRRIGCSVLALVLVAGLSRAEPPANALLDLHLSEAQSYRMARDPEHTKLLTLRQKPVFTWTNLVGETIQSGHLFVWMDAGRPEVIGTVFSARSLPPAKRRVIHEFHTLSEERLHPVTPETSRYQWKPEKGVAIEPVPEAPAVGSAAAQRLQQMRTIARSYSAESEDHTNGQKWELRLLPAPLLQYQPTSGEVLDGALFTMVSSAGTDPEVLLMIEARHPPKDPKGWAWHAAAIRFSDKDLSVKYAGKPLWSSKTDPAHKVAILNEYTLLQVPDKTYTCYVSRIIDELPDKD